MTGLKRYELKLNDYRTTGLIFTSAWLVPALAFDHGIRNFIDNFLEVIGTTAVAFLVLFTSLVIQGRIAELYFKRKNKEFELNAILVGVQGFISGALSGVAAHYLYGLDKPDQYTLLDRVLQAGLVVGTWVPLLMIAVVQVQQLRMRKKELSRELHSRIQIEQSASGVLEHVRYTFENSIRSALKLTALQARAKLSDTLIRDGEVSSNVPALVREFATTDMRNLSRLMLQSPDASSSMSAGLPPRENRVAQFLSHLRAAMRAFIGRRDFWVVPFLILGTLSSGLIGSISLWEGIKLISILGVEMLLVAAIFRIVARQWKAASELFLPIEISIFCFFNFVVITRFIGTSEAIRNHQGWNNRLFLLTMITLFSFIARMTYLLLVSELEARYEYVNFETLKRRYESDLHYNEFVLLAHKWAQHIHGNIQTQLLVAAGTLESSLEKHDLDAFNAALLEVRDLLGNPDSEPVEVHRSIEDELARRANLWSGLITVTGVFQSGIKVVDSSVIRLIGDVLEEALSNAYRHGRATIIDYSLGLNSNGGLILTVIDNGEGITRIKKGVDGLGSRIFDRASNGAFELTRDEVLGETKLEIQIHTS